MPNDFLTGLLGGLQNTMQENKMLKQKMLEQAIQSGQYQPAQNQQPTTFAQRFGSNMLGPQMGGSQNAMMGGQQFQPVTDEMRVDALKKRMALYQGMLGNTSGQPGQTQAPMETDFSVDPMSGDMKINMKSKQADNMMGVEGASDKSPEEIRDALKKKNPAYSKFLQDVSQGKQTLGGRSTKFQQKVMQDVGYLYGVDQQKIQARQKTRNDFSSGNASKNIKSLNTVASHLAEMNKLIPKLDSSNIKMVNRVGQFFGQESGNPTLARFKTVKNALSGELSNIFKNSGGTDTEIKHIGDTIDMADSPEALKAVIDENISLINGRLQALQDQWGNVFDQPGDEKFNVISPRASKILSSIGNNLEKDDSSGKSPLSGKYKMGQSIRKNGINYKVVGFDTDGEPMVDVAK